MTKREIIDRIKILPAIDILDIVEKSMKEIRILNDDVSCDFAIIGTLRNIKEIKTYF